MNIFKPNQTIGVLLIIAFTLSNALLLGQEESITYDYGALKNIKHSRLTKSKTLEDTLELPFFDDFSTSQLFPDDNKWADNMAYINNTFADSPPSIGVATLDAINNKGEFYDNAGYANHFSADELSSLPLNLDYPDDNSMYLSFYYQAKGRYGDYPEESDSLILEFYSVEDSVWNMVWHKLGFEIVTETTTHSPFEKEVIQISESQYLKKGFRFRFRNVASLSSNKEPSKVINADHWHIDYVYLNRGRTENEPHIDLAFVYPIKSALEQYESMPWKHFLANPTSEMAIIPQQLVIKNLYNLDLPIERLYYNISDNSGSEPDYTLDIGSYDISLGERMFDPPFSYSFLTSSLDTASFNVEAKFITDSDDTLSNNQIKYTQKFYDYYAYDDGTAEASYGLSGDGTQNAKLAIQFDIRVEDTLKAVQMYFARSLNDRSQKYFYLTIWDDDNGEPGSIIYQKESVQPEYEDELNKFHTYEINDTVLVLEGRYYIGWVQTTTDMLNLGMDMDRDKSDKIFYNIYGSWENTAFDMALMVRPFFGKNITIPPLSAPTIDPKVIKNNIKVFPNPVKNELTISIEKAYEYDNIKVDIIDYTGRMVHSFDYPGNEPVDISSLKYGVYLLRLRDGSMKLNYTQKIIKTE